MATIMEEAVKIDKHGRLVLPARIRRTMGLEDGGTVVLRLDGRKVIMETSPGVSEEKIRRIAETVLSNHAQMMTEVDEQTSKWFTPEYARRKLGLS